MRPVPAYLHAKLEEQYGPSLAARIEAGFKHERATTLRVNTLKASRDQVQEQLAEAGLRTQTVAWYADALVVAGVDEQRAERWLAAHADGAGAAAAGPRGAEKKGDRAHTGSADPAASAPDPVEAHVGRTARLTPLGVLRAHPLYTDGALYLQSLSAMVPALLAAPRAGQSVLDMCAAPGGKTCQLAALSNNQALITACEKNPLRAERLRYNLAAQDARANVMVEDARRLDPYFSFDAALLDAPCSGSGTVQLMDARQAKRQRFEADLLARTVRTQQALLARALELVPAGGVVTYSTCSILADENEEVVRASGICPPEIYAMGAALDCRASCFDIEDFLMSFDAYRALAHAATGEAADVPVADVSAAETRTADAPSAGVPAANAPSAACEKEVA